MVVMAKSNTIDWNACTLNAISKKKLGIEPGRPYPGLTVKTVCVGEQGVFYIVCVHSCLVDL